MPSPGVYVWFDPLVRLPATRRAGVPIGVVPPAPPVPVLVEAEVVDARLELAPPTELDESLDDADADASDEVALVLPTLDVAPVDDALAVDPVVLPVVDVVSAGSRHATTTRASAKARRRALGIAAVSVSRSFTRRS